VNRTLDRIEAGGSFPYRQDATVFQNRPSRLRGQRPLPERPQGHYREYTVGTPGAKDRGARRVVAGEDGRVYYTDDHYENFIQIDPRRY